jgi:hypothetical protein
MTAPSTAIRQQQNPKHDEAHRRYVVIQTIGLRQWWKRPGGILEANYNQKPKRSKRQATDRDQLRGRRP